MKLNNQTLGLMGQAVKHERWWGSYQEAATVGDIRLQSNRYSRPTSRQLGEPRIHSLLPNCKIG